MKPSTPTSSRRIIVDPSAQHRCAGKGARVKITGRSARASRQGKLKVASHAPNTVGGTAAHHTTKKREPHPLLLHTPLSATPAAEGVGRKKKAVARFFRTCGGERGKRAGKGWQITNSVCYSGSLTAPKNKEPQFVTLRAGVYISVADLVYSMLSNDTRSTRKEGVSPFSLQPEITGALRGACLLRHLSQEEDGNERANE